MSTVAAARPVVVGVDGSDDSAAGLRWAVDEARKRSAPLSVVHAVDLVRSEFFALEDPDFVTEARRAAQGVLDAAVRQARELAPDLEVRPVLDVGTPPVVLLARSARADLVVLGSRGRGGFTGMLLGSTSLQVAMHASRPVVVPRRGRDGASAGPSAGRVVVGADGSLHSARALGFAFERAQDRGLALTAVRAWRSPAIYVDVPSSRTWERLEKEEQARLSDDLAPGASGTPRSTSRSGPCSATPVNCCSTSRPAPRSSWWAATAGEASAGSCSAP
jgi:nucleotide-binding universal stress UspA family protein